MTVAKMTFEPDVKYRVRFLGTPQKAYIHILDALSNSKVIACKEPCIYCEDGYKRATRYLVDFTCREEIEAEGCQTVKYQQTLSPSLIDKLHQLTSQNGGLSVFETGVDVFIRRVRSMCSTGSPYTWMVSFAQGYYARELEPGVPVKEAGILLPAPNKSLSWIQATPNCALLELRNRVHAFVLR